MATAVPSTPQALFKMTGWPLTGESTEIADWNSLSKGSSTQAATSIKVGLFGYDMMALLENCVGAYLDLCPILNRLDGWAVGVEIRISVYTSAPNMYGACFDSSLLCVVATAGSTLSYY